MSANEGCGGDVMPCRCEAQELGPYIDAINALRGCHAALQTAAKNLQHVVTREPTLIHNYFMECGDDLAAAVATLQAELGERIDHFHDDPIMACPRAPEEGPR